MRLVDFMTLAPEYARLPRPVQHTVGCAVYARSALATADSADLFTAEAFLVSAIYRGFTDASEAKVAIESELDRRRAAGRIESPKGGAA